MSRITIETYIPEEGIAIVREQNNLKLIRPPYRLPESSPVAEDAIEKSVLHYGFFSFGEQFRDWSSAIGFLKGKIIEARQSIGDDTASLIPISNFIEVAPPEAIRRFLDKIESGEFNHVGMENIEGVLYCLIESRSIQPEIVVQSARTLSKIRIEKQKIKDNIRELTIVNTRFPGLGARGSYEAAISMARKVKEQHSTFIF